MAPPDGLADILFDKSDQPMLLVGLDGTVMSCNQAAVKYFRLKPSLAGVEWPNILAILDMPEGFDLSELYLAKALSGVNEKVVNLKFVNTRLEEIELELSLFLFNAEEPITLVILQDQTNIKQSERARADFIALTTHQLRTPLTAVKWYIDILKKHYTATMPKEPAQIIDNVARSTGRMIDLIDALMNISLLESRAITLKISDFLAQDMINEILDDLKLEIEHKQINMVVSLHEKLMSVRTDETLLRFVFTNLITNAIKYSKPGGEVHIFLSRSDHSFVTQIHDYGVGIPAADQHKIFQKFFRGKNVLKAKAKGSGLGLYMTKSIVDLLNGSIYFESHENVGTTFWCSFPISTSYISKPAPDNLQVSGKIGSKRKNK